MPRSEAEIKRNAIREVMNVIMWVLITLTLICLFVSMFSALRTVNNLSNPAQALSEPVWEHTVNPDLERSPVPGGWIYRNTQDWTMVFVPSPDQQVTEVNQAEGDPTLEESR